MAGALNGLCQHALGNRGVTKLAASLNARKLVKVAAQERNVLVVNFSDRAGNGWAALALYRVPGLDSSSWRHGLEGNIFDVDFACVSNGGILLLRRRNVAVYWAVFGAGNLAYLIWAKHGIAHDFGFVLLLTVWCFP